jgi:hypothetical protein
MVGAQGRIIRMGCAPPLAGTNPDDVDGERIPTDGVG